LETTKPVVGSAAPAKPVAIKNGTDPDPVATGVIKWTPELPVDGKWETSAYTAIITIVPEPDYYIPAKGVGEAFDDNTVYRVVGYNSDNQRGFGNF